MYPFGVVLARDVYSGCLWVSEGWCGCVLICVWIFEIDFELI